MDSFVDASLELTLVRLPLDVEELAEEELEDELVGQKDEKAYHIITRKSIPPIIPNDVQNHGGIFP